MMNNVSDAEKIMLSTEELENIFLEYNDKLYRFIYMKVRNEHEAEDLLSKTFVKFFNFSKKNAVMKKTLQSFLYTMANNTVTDYFRRKKIVRFVSLDHSIKEDDKNDYYTFFADTTNKSAADVLDSKQMIQEMNKAVDQLPEKQKEAFYLRFMDEFSFVEIAKTQGTSIGTALSRVRYAVEKIKTILNQPVIKEA